jgi:hypothetical protein
LQSHLTTRGDWVERASRPRSNDNSSDMALSTGRSESRVEILPTIYVVSQQGADLWVELWWWQSSWRGCKSSVACQVRAVRLFLGNSTVAVVWHPRSTTRATYVLHMPHAMSEVGRSVAMIVLPVTAGSDNCQEGSESPPRSLAEVVVESTGAV